MKTPKRPIPIHAAEHIAKTYGYEQVVIIARRHSSQAGEHCTTYGIDKANCKVAAQMGDVLKKARWPVYTQRAAEFDEITKRTPTHRVEAAFSMLTPGINWRRAGRPSVRQSYTGENTTFNSSHITAAQLRKAIEKVSQ